MGAALAFVVIGGLVHGIALTVWTVLLFALPLMILFGLIALRFGHKEKCRSPALSRRMLQRENGSPINRSPLPTLGQGSRGVAVGQ